MIIYTKYIFLSVLLREHFNMFIKNIFIKAYINTKTQMKK